MLEAVIFLLSMGMTWAVRHIARKKRLLDVPNARSSHSVPTPRGGGIAIVVAFYLGLLALWTTKGVEPSLFWALMAALPIAIVGLVDDIVSLGAGVRLAVQTLAAAGALLAMRDHLTLDFYFFRLEEWWSVPIFLIGMIWLTNLYNFLDGIDGYAGAEALFVAWGGYLFFHHEFLVLLGFAVAGFLVFNWPRASIFMGDVGSAFLGFVFAVLLLYFSDGKGDVWIWLVLLGLFWFDATLTLYRRYRNGESLAEAHRKHAYQRLVQSGFSHRETVVWSIFLNLLGLGLLILVRGTVWSAVVGVVWLLFLYGIVRYVDRRKAFEKS